MGTIREMRVTFEDREVDDEAVGRQVRDLADVAGLMSFLRCSADEEVWAVILDAGHRVIARYQAAKGGRHETKIDPASLYRSVLLAEGFGFVIVHNHPQGPVKPSPADIRTTELIVLAGYALNIPLLDHVIIGPLGTFSFLRTGLLGWLQAKQLRALGVKGIPDMKNPMDAETEAREGIAGLGKKEPEAGNGTPILPEPCEACRAAGFKTCNGPHVALDTIERIRAGTQVHPAVPF